MRASEWALWWALALSCVCAALSVSPASAQAPARDGELYGVLFASEGGGPVEGAEVRVGELRAVSNRDGAFRLRLAPGVYALRLSSGSPVEVKVSAGLVTQALITVSAEGSPELVEIAAPGVEVEAAASGEEAPKGPPGRLRGRVVHEESGEAVVGAQILVRGERAGAVRGAARPDGDPPEVWGAGGARRGGGGRG
jgi:hypothetical protein